MTEAASYTPEQLSEALRQIDSTLGKLRATLATLEARENADRLKPQITLARRRIDAFEIAADLVSRELSSSR
ncbi:MAG: hypothetical protein HFJ75_00585 [Eggerthellaceae bacterium]|nr:hypothetical protein [Eggerthellaceae bacterium]